jgi:hypothetical protein
LADSNRFIVAEKDFVFPDFSAPPAPNPFVSNAFNKIADCAARAPPAFDVAAKHLTLLPLESFQLLQRSVPFALGGKTGSSFLVHFAPAFAYFFV